MDIFENVRVLPYSFQIFQMFQIIFMSPGLISGIDQGTFKGSTSSCRNPGMFTKSHMFVPVAPTNIGSSAASTFVKIYKISHERIWDTVLESEEVSHPIRCLIDYLKTM